MRDQVGSLWLLLGERARSIEVKVSGPRLRERGWHLALAFGLHAFGRIVSVFERISCLRACTVYLHLSVCKVV